jgi:hypothetical protein
LEFDRESDNDREPERVEVGERLSDIEAVLDFVGERDSLIDFDGDLLTLAEAVEDLLIETEIEYDFDGVVDALTEIVLVLEAEIDFVFERLALGTQ